MVRLIRVTHAVRDAARGIQNASLHLPPGAVGFLVGPAASGKTVILELCRGDRLPDSGQVVMNGVDTRTMTHRTLQRLRQSIGYSSRLIPLLPHRTVLDNVMIPCELRGMGWHRTIRAAMRILDELEALHLAQARPPELSSGERRLAILARALVHRPMLVLADDPFSGLPEGYAPRVLELFSQQTARGGALMVACRNPDLAPTGARLWRLQEGVIESYEVIPPQVTGATSAVVASLLRHEASP